YIYDDRIVFVYNYKSGTDTVMLKDIEAVLGSDFQNVSPPKKRNACRKTGVFAFCIIHFSVFILHYSSPPSSVSK
ncbi:MAG: hypothetical protein IKS39_11445, partial [Clostridia bacterium]|nr:hypothetical protein [Clostridia bacterium]